MGFPNQCYICKGIGLVEKIDDGETNWEECERCLGAGNDILSIVGPWDEKYKIE